MIILISIIILLLILYKLNNNKCREKFEECRISKNKIDSKNIEINISPSRYDYEYPNELFNKLIRDYSKPLNNYQYKTINTISTDKRYKLILKIEDFFNNITKELFIPRSEKFKVVQFVFNNGKESFNDEVYDIDVLIYREGKNHGKHINMKLNEEEIYYGVVKGIVISYDIEKLKPLNSVSFKDKYKLYQIDPRLTRFF